MSFQVSLTLGEHLNTMKDLVEKTLNIESEISVLYLALPPSSSMSLSRSFRDRARAVDQITDCQISVLLVLFISCLF